ncbi:MAG: serine/threonine protein kinase [Gemmataceae bacterium]
MFPNHHADPAAEETDTAFTPKVMDDADEELEVAIMPEEALESALRQSRLANSDTLPPPPGYQLLNRMETISTTESLWLAEDEKSKRRVGVRYYRGATETRWRVLEAPGYQLNKPLGSGAFGEVWLAEEENFPLKVAIKFYKHGTESGMKDLQQDVKALALVDEKLHGVVHIRDVNYDNDPPFCVMTYAEGGSLRHRIDKEPPLDVQQAVAIFRQITDALSYIHSRGIIHCDLKPDNVLLDFQGQAMLTDFGQSRLSWDATPALGTLFYMAPEQADALQNIPDTRWDVYGLGAILFTMLTRERPRDNSPRLTELEQIPKNYHNLPKRLQVYQDVIRAAPPPTEHPALRQLDRPLRHILGRCLELDPDKRYRDAGAVLAALDERDRQRRQRPIIWFGLLAPLILCLVIGVFVVHAMRQALADSERILTGQIERSNQSAARLIANMVDKELGYRKRGLEQLAQNETLRQTLQEYSNLNAPLREKGILPDESQQQAKEAIRSRLRNVLHEFARDKSPAFFRNCNVTDNTGEIVAVYFLDEDKAHMTADLIGQSFAFRDWFNGTGDKISQQDQLFAPIRATHISQPYVGKVADSPSNVSISTPVFAPDSSEIIGVLAITIQIDDTQGWLNNVDFKGGYAVLCNNRGHCIRHGEEFKNRYLPLPNQNPKIMDEYLRLRDQAAARDSLSIPRFVDPISQETCVVGCAANENDSWLAMVQHEHDQVMAPIHQLQRQMILKGGILLATVIAVIVCLWAWLIGLLRRKEQQLYG